MNRKHSIIVALGLSLLAGSASAHRERYASARVVAVEPLYQTVFVDQPVTTCHRETVARRVADPAVVGTTLAGAVVGAAVGRQFGSGSGRDAMTAIGAIAGSAVANRRAVSRRGGAVTVVHEPVDRCQTTYRREAQRMLTGYWVDYRHRGRIYRILTNERPGRFIRVAVGS